MDSKQSDAFERVTDLVRFLRAHCPWDAAQTPRSLIPYLLEEAHESADAIAEEDDAALRSELGDLMLNVAFQIVLAEERAAFGADQVADTVIDKMKRRHPHLYGLGEQQEWEALKARERAPDAGILHGVSKGLDPLSRAHRIQDRVAAVGFDWADAAGAFEKVAEELEEVREAMETLRRQRTETADGDGERVAAAPAGDVADAAAAAQNTAAAQNVAAAENTAAAQNVAAAALEEELGDLLFAVVNLARLAGAHALTALHDANAKFSRRFEALERLAAERGIALEDAGLEALDGLWDEIKAREG